MTARGPRDHTGTGDWLARAVRDGAPCGEALAVFDRLPAVDCGDILGRWRGRGLHTGHPLDGALEAFGWYGKDLRDGETVFPLLFCAGHGRVDAIAPAWLPLRLVAHWRLQERALARTAFPVARRLLRTRRPSARLRALDCRGRVSAAIVYDRLPVIDALRAVDAHRLLGLMDCRYFDAPLFFVLWRD